MIFKIISKSLLKLHFTTASVGMENLHTYSHVKNIVGIY